jgi:RecB family exonuclease
MVLWAVWDGIGLGETWQEMALRGGPAGVRADSDLDAVLALFAAANRHDARRPGSGVGGFLDYLAAQEVPSDTIAPHAPRVGKVTVSTVAGAVGHEWDVVALAGLEEGVWPDLRLRDTLLGAGQLADLVSAGLTALDPVERRRAVAEDETRLLVLAATRARRELLAVAVDNDEDQPSRFFEWLAGGPPDAGGLAAGLVGGLTAGLGGGGDALIGGWQVPFDLRGVVAAARARLVPAKAPPGSLAERDPVTGLDEQRPAVPDASAAAVLAILAALGVDGADPAVWPGLLPQSTDAPLFPAEREPTLSPSALERLADCPLSWALGRVGGTVAVGAAANLGTLIHSLAEEFGTPEQLSQYPRLDGLKGELTRRLEERWSELGLEDNYTNRGLALRARNMVQNLASYLDGCRDLAYVAVEARFGWGPNRPGERAGEQPGEQSGTRSGKQSGEQAGAGPGAELGAGPGAELGAGLGAQPGEPRRGLPVALRGKVDRIERDATGATQVVDFKTGASVPTAQSAKRNPQLGAYQAALAAGLVEGFAPTEADGAKLVYLDHVVRGQVKQLHQSALNSAEPWLDQFLADCRTTVGRSWFEAHPSPRTCANCAVIGSCPALNQGKQVTP